MHAYPAYADVQDFVGSVLRGLAAQSHQAVTKPCSASWSLGKPLKQSVGVDRVTLSFCMSRERLTDTTNGPTAVAEAFLKSSGCKVAHAMQCFEERELRVSISGRLGARIPVDNARPLKQFLKRSSSS